MTDKGRYKLTSYFVDRNLVFFTSTNKIKKIFAFSMLELSQNLPIILSMLRDLLEKRLLSHFSIEISILDNINQYLILSFTDFDRKHIIKLFNSIYIRLCERANIEIPLLEKKELEKTFFDMGFANINSNVHKVKSTDSIIIENEGEFHLLDVYSLNLYNLEKKSNFFYNFANLIKKLNRKGHLIFNAKMKGTMPIINAYFIEYKNNLQDEFNLKHEINHFFDHYIANKFKPNNFSILFNILFRLPLGNSYLRWENLKELLSERISDDSEILDMFSLLVDFEKQLIENEICYEKVEENSFLIEGEMLLIVFEQVDYNLLGRIFTEIYPRYSIVIVIIDDGEFKRFMKQKKLLKLPKVKIFDLYEFKNFNIKSIKI